MSENIIFEAKDDLFIIYFFLVALKAKTDGLCSSYRTTRSHIPKQGLEDLGKS